MVDATAVGVERRAPASAAQNGSNAPAVSPAMHVPALRLLPLVTLLAAAPTLLATPDAHACACCDGTVSITPLRWTADGESVLLRVDDTTACEHHTYVKLLGRDGAERCVDLNGDDPRAEIDCGSTVDNVGASGPSATKHAPQDTSLWAAAAADAKPLTKKEHRVKVRASPDGEDGPSFDQLVTVDVRVKGRWRKLWEGVVAAAPYCPPDDSGCTEHDIAVKVWPSPDGKTALVTISYHDYLSFGTTLYRVDLPK